MWDTLYYQFRCCYPLSLTLFSLLKENGERDLICQFCFVSGDIYIKKKLFSDVSDHDLNSHSKGNFFSLIAVYIFLLILHTTFQMVHEIAKYATPMLSCTKVNFLYHTTSRLSSAFCPKPAYEVYTYVCAQNLNSFTTGSPLLMRFFETLEKQQCK